jgi:pimeloyl-ACP methyl ester carboxylesterase
MALEHRFLRPNGVRLHCVVDGEGPLVILLHGFPEYWAAWKHQIAALAPHFRVVAPDLRGYNESDKPLGLRHYTLDALVGDVEGLVHAFGEREAVIVGHDWGGALAWSVAIDRPAITRKLVVMNCPHPAVFAENLRGGNRKQLWKSWYMFFFQIPRLPEWLLGLGHARAIGRAFERSTVQRGAFSAEDIANLRDVAAKPGALRSALNYYRAIFRSPEALAQAPAPVRRFLGRRMPAPTRPLRLTRADWPRIQAPTLLIWGEQDIALRKELTYGMESLFDAPLTIRYLPDSGHWVQNEKPEEVNRWLLEFLSDQTATASQAASVGTAPDAPQA